MRLQLLRVRPAMGGTTAGGVTDVPPSSQQGGSPALNSAPDHSALNSAPNQSTEKSFGATVMRASFETRCTKCCGRFRWPAGAHMAACPTCFTKVDITTAAVRAAKYASAARDRYERKYRQIKCDVVKAVCASAAEKRTAAGATPCAPTLPVPAFSTGKHSQQWDPQWGPHCDDWDDGDAPQQVVPPGREWDISRDPQCQFTDDESDDGQDPQWHILIARNGTLRTICGAADSPVGVSLTRLSLRMWRQTLTLGWLTPTRSRRQMIQTVALIRPASHFLS